MNKTMKRCSICEKEIEDDPLQVRKHIKEYHENEWQQYRKEKGLDPVDELIDNMYLKRVAEEEEEAN